MKQEVEFEYFHGYEAEQFAFYRIPKLLFTDNYFRGLSSDAKILYGLMLDRMALSVKNRWIDKGIYYLYAGASYGVFKLRQRQGCEDPC